jgi:Thymidylate kinase
MGAGVSRKVLCCIELSLLFFSWSSPVLTLIFNFRARMRKLLNGGTTLIVDRYAFSGVAYSAAKDVKKIVFKIM